MAICPGILVRSRAPLTTKWPKVNYAIPSNILIFIKADIISAVEFNHDGELLATGDKGGRVVIFQRNDLQVCFGSNLSNNVL